ncbi:MAG: phosphohydrolase, partial [Candidatus Omnitrophica bacterium]|nr:phosphohydrolase [Candidatus Omnitrophota bacterium]
FRYSGPKPQTREVAIVMLADSVEGACRALDDPSPARIDEVVRKVINNKFIDGQLDECTLTLKDLELIGMTFTRVLSAIYHTRVKYPEKRKEPRPS